MPANKYALVRYRVIDRCISSRSKPFPSREDLQYACREALYGSGCDEISISTIDKDIWAMRNEGELGYYAPIGYSKLNGGYYYTEEGYSINKVNLNEDEYSAVRLAAATLSQFKEVPMFKDFGAAIQRIADRLSLTPRTGEPQEAVIQFETAPAAAGSEHLTPLLEAITAGQEVRFRYTSFVNDAESERIIRPYLLKEFRNRWYVIGRNLGKDGLRTFGLDRISDLSPTGRHFASDPDFDPDSLFTHSFGITAGGKPERITLRIGHRQAQFVLTQPLHPTQEVLREDAEGITVRIHVIPSAELHMTILSMGTQAEVISPDHLRQEIAEELRKAARAYT